MTEGVRLYVGGDAYTVQGRRCFLTGDRMFSGAYGPVSRFLPEHVPHVCGMLDSGAFSDAPEERLSAEEALERQFRWEREATRLWGHPWQAEAFCSYDLLIDEKWTGNERKKERWSVKEADAAVRVTIDAAAYLSSQREALSPRRLVLACQGVDGAQYEDCVRGVLSYSTPADSIGLGGWCILGLYRSWLPTFFDAMRRVLPLIAGHGIRDIHIFGVMYPKALGGAPVAGRPVWPVSKHG